MDLIYSPRYGVLVANFQTEVQTIDVLTHAVTTHAPIAAFAMFPDIAISPSGRYVFAADWGGDNFGGNYPGGPVPNPNYIHRLDLATGIWETPETSYEGGHVQAVADDQIIVSIYSQFAQLVNERWTSGTDTLPLNAPTNTFDAPAYVTDAYGGEFRYAPASGRLLIGSQGLSSNDIEAYRLSGDNFVTQESTGVYGSAQAYGGTEVLATDGSGFYYGRLEVDPLDVTHQLRIFPEQIYAASGDLAFGSQNYYDARSGQAVGSILADYAQVYALNAAGTDLWVYDPLQSMLRRFVQDAIFADPFGN